MPPNETGSAAPGSGEANKAVNPTDCVSRDPPDIENLLGLNPRIKPYASAVPSVVTKKVMKYFTGKTEPFQLAFFFEEKYLIKTGQFYPDIQI